MKICVEYAFNEFNIFLNYMEYGATLVTMKNCFQLTLLFMYIHTTYIAY